MRSVYILSAIMLFAVSGRAYAESDTLFITAGIVQCGALDELNYACEYDKRCCSLKETYWEEPPEDLYELESSAEFRALMKTITVEPEAGEQPETLNIAIQ